MAKSRTRQVLVNGTNLAAATNYYPSSDGENVSRLTKYAAHIVTTGGVTITLEASLDDTGATWVDITESVKSLLTGVDSAASYVDATTILTFDPANLRRIRWKSVTADASNTVRIVTVSEGDNIQLSA